MNHSSRYVWVWYRKTQVHKMRMQNEAEPDLDLLQSVEGVVS